MDSAKQENGRDGVAAQENRKQSVQPEGQTFHGHRTPLRGDGRRGGGTVEDLPCGADTKDTKNHEEARRARNGSLEVWRLGSLDNSVRGNRQASFSARTPVCAKPDGLTPVALRAKRPLIAPSRPSASRLEERRRGVERSPTKNANQLISQSAKLPLPH